MASTLSKYIVCRVIAIIQRRTRARHQRNHAFIHSTRSTFSDISTLSTQSCRRGDGQPDLSSQNFDPDPDPDPDTAPPLFRAIIFLTSEEGGEEEIK